VAVGQLTEPSAPSAGGSDGTLHVAPPSEEISNCPRYGPALPGVTPTLTHSAALGQSTPNKVVLLVGREEDVHVAPPSFVRTETPWPTATHCDKLTQLTDSSTGSPEANVPGVHVAPPLFVVETEPPLPLLPTATHSCALEHETPR